MTSAPPTDDGESPHWRRNLAVCVAGSFTTIVAMTLLLPFLPLYVAELGVRDPAAIVEWSGVAYGATFFTVARRTDSSGGLTGIALGRPVLTRYLRVAHEPWKFHAVDWLHTDTTLVERAFPWFAAADFHSAHRTPGVARC